MDVNAVNMRNANMHGRSNIVMEKCRSEINEDVTHLQPSFWMQQLKYLRKRNNLSQADVAKVLHCSQVAYGLYELGKRKLPIERLIILAKFYNVSLDSLTGISGWQSGSWQHEDCQW